MKRTRLAETWLIPVIVGCKSPDAGGAETKQYVLIQLEEARRTSPKLFCSTAWGQVTRHFCGDGQDLRLLTTKYLENQLGIKQELAELLVKVPANQQADGNAGGAKTNSAKLADNNAEMEEKTPPELRVSFVSAAFRSGDLHWTEKTEHDNLLTFCLRETASNATHQFVFGDWKGMRLAARDKGTSEQERTDLVRISLINDAERRLRLGTGLEMPFLMVPHSPHPQSTMIVQYADPLFKEWYKEEGRRLIIDISSSQVNITQPIWESRQRLIEEAFNLPPNHKVCEVPLDLFERLKGMSLDATKRLQNGANLVIFNPLNKAGRAEVAVAPIKSEYINSYFDTPGQDGEKAKELPFPTQWTKTVNFSGKFKSVSHERKTVNGVLLPLTLCHSDLTASRFELVTLGGTALYVQDFEITIRDWRTFLESTAGKEFLSNHGVNEDTVKEIFGDKWSRDDPMQTYLAGAAKRRWPKQEGAKRDDPLEVNRDVLSSMQVLMKTFYEPGKSELPMRYVDRPAIDAFCSWVNKAPKKEEAAPAYVTRLPTAKEADLLKNNSKSVTIADDEPLVYKDSVEKVHDYWDLDDHRRIVGLRRNALEMVGEGDPSGELWNGLNRGELCDDKHFDQFTGFRLIVSPIGK